MCYRLQTWKEASSVFDICERKKNRVRGMEGVKKDEERERESHIKPHQVLFSPLFCSTI